MITLQNTLNEYLIEYNNWLIANDTFDSLHISYNSRVSLIQALSINSLINATGASEAALLKVEYDLGVNSSTIAQISESNTLILQNAVNIYVTNINSLETQKNSLLTLIAADTLGISTYASMYAGASTDIINADRVNKTNTTLINSSNLQLTKIAKMVNSFNSNIVALNILNTEAINNDDLINLNNSDNFSTYTSLNVNYVDNLSMYNNLLNSYTLNFEDLGIINGLIASKQIRISAIFASNIENGKKIKNIELKNTVINANVDEINQTLVNSKNLLINQVELINTANSQLSSFASNELLINALKSDLLEPYSLINGNNIQLTANVLRIKTLVADLEQKTINFQETDINVNGNDLIVLNDLFAADSIKANQNTNDLGLIISNYDTLEKALFLKSGKIGGKILKFSNILNNSADITFRIFPLLQKCQYSYQIQAFVSGIWTSVYSNVINNYGILNTQNISGLSAATNYQIRIHLTLDILPGYNFYSNVYNLTTL